MSFSKLSNEERFQKLKEIRNVCRRCVNVIRNFDTHKVIDQKCPFQRNPCSKCNNFSHSTYLHVDRQGNRTQGSRYNNGNASNNTGRKDLRNSNQPRSFRGQFKRPLRSQRLAQATKVSLTVPRNNDDEIIEELNHMNVNMMTFKTTPLFKSQD